MKRAATGEGQPSPILNSHAQYLLTLVGEEPRLWYATANAHYMRRPEAGADKAWETTLKELYPVDARRILGRRCG